MAIGRFFESLVVVPLLLLGGAFGVVSGSQRQW